MQFTRFQFKCTLGIYPFMVSLIHQRKRILFWKLDHMERCINEQRDSMTQKWKEIIGSQLYFTEIELKTRNMIFKPPIWSSNHHLRIWLSPVTSHIFLKIWVKLNFFYQVESPQSKYHYCFCWILVAIFTIL